MEHILGTDQHPETFSQTTYRLVTITEHERAFVESFNRATAHMAFTSAEAKSTFFQGFCFGFKVYDDGMKAKDTTTDIRLSQLQRLFLSRFPADTPVTFTITPAAEFETIDNLTLAVVLDKKAG